MAGTINAHSSGKKLLGHLGALVTMGAWGSSFVCTKVLMNEGDFTPVEMFTYRFAAAYVILLCLSFKKLFANSWAHELQFMVCGVCAGSLYFILENYALGNNTSTGNVSLLGSISPLFTTLLLAIVFRQRIKSGVIIGSIMAFFGVACVILNKEGFEFHPGGDLLAICASLAWAIYTVIAKNLIPVYNGMFITRKLFLYGVLTSLPLLFMQQEPYHIGILIEPKFLFNFLFLVVMCSALAYVIWNEVMRTLGPITASNYIYMQPMVTMVVAYFVLDEHIFLIGYVGCAFIIGGLIIADKWNPSFSMRRRGKISPKK